MDGSVKSAQDAKCINCGGKLQFDPESGKLKCVSCGSLFTTEEIDAQWGVEEAKRTEPLKTEVEEDDELQAYDCNSCGAQLMVNSISGSLKCPYCGNVVIAAEKFTGNIKPDHIVGFSFTKEQAMQKYHEYYEKRFLLPGSFRKDSHVAEVQGVYVPFWLFNGKASIDAEYDAYDVVKSTDDYEVQEHYDVKRKGSLLYKRVPTDASKRMPDDLMDSIEPFNLNEVKPFSMSYLPGFMAERFDVNEKDNEKRAKERVENSIKDMTEETVDHEHCDEERCQVSFSETNTEYALLPVWLLFTKWNGEEYKFAMNGQTGKMIGDLPVSGPKMLSILIPIFAAVMYLCMGILEVGVFGSIVASVIVAGIVALFLYDSMKPVTNASNANDYIAEKLKLTLEEEKGTGRKKVSK